MITLLNNNSKLLKYNDAKDIPVLASIPWLPRSVYASFYPPNFKDSEKIALNSMAYQNFVLNLTSQTEPTNRCIMFTSSYRDKSPSWILMNLAYFLCQQSKRVLIIDADFNSPSIHLAFDTEICEESQLINAVEKLSSKFLFNKQFFSWDEIGQYCRSNNEIPGLSLLTNMPVNPSVFNTVDLFTLSILLMYLKKEFDWIIIDSAPIMDNSASKAIAKLVDGVVLIKEYNAQQQRMQSIKELTKTAQIPLVGIVQRFNEQLFKY